MAQSFSSFTVVYDACVLYPASLRDLLIRLGQTGLFRARWTQRIVDEALRSLAAARSDLSPDRLARTGQLINASIRDCLVTGHEELTASLQLPDEDDRHVLAAAIRCGAQAIVTANVRDFPQAALDPFGIEVQTPDAFVSHLVDLGPEAVARTLVEQAAALRSPPMSVWQLMDRLRGVGLEHAVSAARGWVEELAAERPPDAGDEGAST